MTRRCIGALYASASVICVVFVVYGPVEIFRVNRPQIFENEIQPTDLQEQSLTLQGKPIRDEYFEPILDTFRYPARYAVRNTFRSGYIPKLFFLSSAPLSGGQWTQPFSQFYQDECSLPCNITDSINEIASADAIVIFLRELQSIEQLHQFFPQRDLTQPWIVHATECPVTGTIKRLPYRSMNGLFNRTMYFRRDSDIQMTHGFLVPKEDARYLPMSWHSDPPAIKKLPFDERKMAVAFISNCRDRSGRLDYINELSKYIHVDIFGACGKQKCDSTKHDYNNFRIENDNCQLKAAQKYLFYLSFENNIAEDYVTEKLFNILYYPVVPVVLGGADYSKILPQNSYINALHYTPENLSRKLQNLSENQEEYEAMMSWREDYEVSTVGIKRVYCQLCTKLYDPQFYETNIYHDFYDWYVNKSMSNRHYSKELNKFTTFEETDKWMV